MEGVAIMHKEVISTFSTLEISRNILCSPLCRGSEYWVGFVIKTLLKPQMVVPKGCSSFIFFIMNVSTGQVKQHIYFLPYGIDEIQLCYSHEDKIWMLVAGGKDVLVTKLDLVEENEIVHPHMLSDVGLGDKTIVAVWCEKHVCSIIFAVTDLAEEGPASIYLAQWDMKEACYKRVQLIERSDVILAHIFPGSFLLFTCRHEEAPDISAVPANNAQEEMWSIAVAAYRDDALRLSSREIPDISIPVRNSSLPVEDLFDQIACTMKVAQGPSVSIEGQTCIVALELQDVARGVDFAKTFRGGLFQIDTDSEILQRTKGRVGTNLSICRCGDLVIGTDMLDGKRRLWYWDLGEEEDIEVMTYLSDELKRATLLAYEPRVGELNIFWSVEEYMRGIRIAQWEIGRQQVGGRREFKELEAVWYENIALLEARSIAYSQQREAMVIEDGVAVLGVNQERKLEMILVRDGVGG